MIDNGPFESNALWGIDLRSGQAVFFDDSERYLKQPIVANGKLFVGCRGKVVSFENFGTGFMPVQRECQDLSDFGQNWPNPFRHSTRFKFTLDQPDFLDISVYDLSGKNVKTISCKKFETGTYILTWDGTNDSYQKVSPGIYILKLTTRKHIKSHRMVLHR